MISLRVAFVLNFIEKRAGKVVTLEVGDMVVTRHVQPLDSLLCLRWSIPTQY
jgi:hypothetical protein